MLSRDADACYWIGRYVERAEATSRMVDVHYHAALETFLPTVLEENDQETSPLRWHSLLAISGAATTFEKKARSGSDRDVLYFFAFDPENHNSILSTWKAARENARAIREQISSEMWESVNIAYHKLRSDEAAQMLTSSPHEFFEMVKNASHLFQGILNRTMVMGETRDWLDLGRFSERADQTTRLLDVKYADLLPDGFSREDGDADLSLPLSPLEMHGWTAVLKSVSAYEMYRKTHRDGIRPATVIDFLLLNPQFPASVRHCAGRLEGCLHRISGAPRAEPVNEPERLVGRLLADLTYIGPEEIINDGLHAFLENTQVRLLAIGNAITRTFLAY